MYSRLLTEYFFDLSKLQHTDTVRLFCQHIALITTVALYVQSHAELDSYLLQFVAQGLLCTVTNS